MKPTAVISLALACSCGKVNATADAPTRGIDAIADTSADANHCSDGVRDADETDVDCGGSCSKCSVNLKCLADGVTGDCSTGYCFASHCAQVSGPPSWIALPAAPTTVYNAHVALAGNLLYLIGGEGHFTTVQAFDIAAGAWKTSGVSQLSGNGTAGGGAAVDSSGNIYTIGNYAVGDAAFKGDAGGWLSFAAVPSSTASQRFACGAVLAADGQIYSIGGVDGPAGTSTPAFVPNVASYSFTTSSWSTSPPSLSMARDELGVTVDATGRIYAVGGENPFQHGVAIVESFLPGTDTSWQLETPLTTHRYLNGAIAAPDGRIYAIGGFEDASAAQQDEAYVRATGVWTPTASIQTEWVGGRVYTDGRMFVANSNAAFYYGPLISSSASTGASATTFQLSGSNFAANASVRIYFAASAITIATADTTTPIATAVTDGSGALDVTSVTVPAVAAGTYQISAIDDRSLYPVHIPFTVTP